MCIVGVGVTLGLFSILLLKLAENLRAFPTARMSPFTPRIEMSCERDGDLHHELRKSDGPVQSLQTDWNIEYLDSRF
jgi:hypothetical protein